MKRLQPNPPFFLSCLSFLLLFLPLLLRAETTDLVEDLVGPMTEDQQLWLEEQPASKTALAAIARRSYWPGPEQAADAIFDHFTREASPILMARQLAHEVAILKVLHPEWSPARAVFNAAWNMAKGQAHSILDLAGLVPGFGEGADLVNGVFYWLEGDKANATLSFAAMVPFLGWTATGAKYAGKLVKTAAGRTAELKFVVDSNGLINFGKRGQLTRVIGRKAGHQAHHIIPWAMNNHIVVQIAADSGKWHPNLALNGTHLDLARHNGFLTKKAHKIYNEKVRAELDKVLDIFGTNISPEDAFKQLKKTTAKIEVQLDQGKKLNEIVL